MISKMFFTKSGERPSDGSSSSSSLGLAMSPRADGQHLLLAARQGAAQLLLALLQAREEGEDPLDVPLPVRAGALDEGAHPEVLEDGHLREDLAPLRDLDDAQLDHLVRLELGRGPCPRR